MKKIRTFFRSRMVSWFPAQLFLMTFLYFILTTDLCFAFRFPRQPSQQPLPHPKPTFSPSEQVSTTSSGSTSTKRTDNSPVPEVPARHIRMKMFISDLGMMEQKFESVDPSPLSRPDRELPTATSMNSVTHFRVATRRATSPGVGIHHDESSWAKGVKLLARLLRFNA